MARGVTRPAIGTRVAVFAGAGGLAEYGVFDAARCVPIPDAMPFRGGSGLPHRLWDKPPRIDPPARLQQGERLLVLGAGGGVGLTAVELGAAMGAEVIAVARGADKLEAAKSAGAHHLLDARSVDLKAEVKALGGADVVYDAVGGAMFKDAMRATNPEGRILVIGFASGEMPQIAPNHLLVKNIDVIGFYWGGYMRFGAEQLDRQPVGADADVRGRAHKTAYRRDPAAVGLRRGAGSAEDPWCSRENRGHHERLRRPHMPLIGLPDRLGQRIGGRAARQFGPIKVDADLRQVRQPAVMVDPLHVGRLGALDAGMHRQIGGDGGLHRAAGVAFHRHFPGDRRPVERILHAAPEDAVVLEGKAQGPLLPDLPAIRADPDEPNG
jgi:hypothetical protein